MTDWGDGAYEAFSDRLMPAAMRLAEIAAPREGEHAVDLGSGDGNLALWLARSGATVTAVEPSERLLGLAAQRCAAAELRVTPLVGAAEAMPLADGSADLIASNFAVIFSEDPEQAISEVLRVLRPGGRFVYSAWVPEGAIAETSKLFKAAFAERLGPPPEGAPPPPAPPAWHDPLAWLAELVPGSADAITVHEGVIDFIAESGAAWNAEQSATHPMWREARAALGDEAAWSELMAKCAAVLDDHSSLPEAMVVASPYVVVDVRPSN